MQTIFFAFRFNFPREILFLVYCLKLASMYASLKIKIYFIFVRSPVVPTSLDRLEFSICIVLLQITANIQKFSGAIKSVKFYKPF